MLEILKIIHFLSLAVGIGLGVASMVLGARAAAAQGPAIGALRGTQGILGRISFAAIILLWITGIWLWLGYQSGATSTLFWLKIALVVVLTGLSLNLNLKGLRAARGGPPMNPAHAKRVGQTASLVSVLIVCVAVVNFT